MTIYEKFLEDNGFKALSNEMLFDKAYNAGIDAVINRITMAPYNTKDAESKILFSLTMNELTELIKNQPDGELKERLKTAQTVWEDFSNSRKAEEEAI